MQSIQFIDRQSILSNKEAYLDVSLDAQKILKSWHKSVFSYEWMTPEGQIKDKDALSEKNQERYDDIYNKIQNNTPIEKPILGIGIMDHVEIGTGRAELVIACANGLSVIPAHIRKANQDDFKAYLHKK